MYKTQHLFLLSGFVFPEFNTNKIPPSNLSFAACHHIKRIHPKIQSVVTSCGFPVKRERSRLQLQLCLGSTERLITACSKQMAAMGQTVYLCEFLRQIKHSGNKETISQLVKLQSLLFSKT